MVKSAKPTQRTIANELGIAVTTVSKALAGDSRIALRTRVDVERMAQNLGYVPDRAAQRLRTGKTNVITLVLDPHSELLDFGATLISGIAEVVRSTQYTLTIMQYQLGEDVLSPIKFIVQNRLADGLLFARTEHEDARVKYLLDAEFPFVTHGRTNLSEHAWYDYDNKKFAELAVERLTKVGAKHIGLIPPGANFTYRQFMIDGLARGAEENDICVSLSPDFDLTCSPDTLYRCMLAWLKCVDRPDALICPGEVSAMVAYSVANDLGITMPILAKQTSATFSFIRPRPLAIYEDIQDAGRRMTDMLLKIIAGGRPRDHQILQAPKWE